MTDTSQSLISNLYSRSPNNLSFAIRHGHIMYITEYRVTPIAFGDPPLHAASGLHAPYALRTIVEVVSDEGITGVGETHGGADTARDLEAVRDLVIGRDPFQLAAL